MDWGHCMLPNCIRPYGNCICMTTALSIALLLKGGLKMQDWKMEEQILGQGRRWKMRDRKMEDQKMEDRKL